MQERCWWAIQESNPEQPGYEPGDLPIDLMARKKVNCQATCSVKDPPWYALLRGVAGTLSYLLPACGYVWA